jgi:acetoacetyl-CoA synthetase
MVQEGDVLWNPSEEFKRASNIYAFMQWLNERYGTEFSDYESLWEWSVADIERLWQCLWDYFGLESSTPYECVLKNREMPGAEWFPGAKVNYAQHVLRHAGSDSIALRYLSEIRPLGQVTWKQLTAQTSTLAAKLRELGVKPGDRVVSLMPNIPETVIAFLATASVGAIWSNCSPEYGAKSAMDRFTQIDPVVLFTVDGYRYGGTDFDRRDAVRDLIDALPTLTNVISVAYLFPEDTFLPTPNAIPWAAVQAGGRADFVPIFEDVDFDHPLWIVYSSGTTGLPKPFVHGHGGILLELLKFCTFHMNLKRDSVTFMFTTSGWITWNVRAL